MGACYSHKAIAHPYPGGFSRNGVEKVWLHRSFLATLACLDAVTRGSRQKRLCRRCDRAVAPAGEERQKRKPNENGRDRVLPLSEQGRAAGRNRCLKPCYAPGTGR